MENRELVRNLGERFLPRAACAARGEWNMAPLDSEGYCESLEHTGWSYVANYMKKPEVTSTFVDRCE